MNRIRIVRHGWPLLLLTLVGCGFPAAPPVAEQRRAPERPAPAARKPEVSFDTTHDGRFAEFVADKSGGMVKKVAVGIERKGVMRVEVADSVEPEDVLPLTKSLVSGARKDFPGKAFTLSVYDPNDQPILKAHYRPDEGVHYEVAGAEHGRSRTESTSGYEGPGKSLPPKGTTDKDRRFADWAMKTAPRYLRYVQADLEKRGRLWFGITREVRPEDLRDLTKSLLQGAHQEFPRRELTATVFDPDGEKVGRATLSADGRVHWSR